MKKDPDKENSDAFSNEIANKEKRKINALENKSNVWFGLGMMGMVGWSVVVPVLFGALLGSWLDKKYPQTFSWTLTLLISGLLLGSVIAWYWVDKEDREMHQNKKKENE